MLAAFPGTRMFGLLSFNDGRDRVFTTASYTFSYDSNIFDSGSTIPDQTNPGSTNKGDFIQSAALGIEYTRRAGLIGVNASIGWSFGRFNRHSTENFANPSASLKLTKGTGRITGAFTLSVARQSSSDAAANVRSESWSYNSGVETKYPIDQRFYLTSSTAFSLNRYVSTTSLSNLTSFRQGADVFYVYSSKLDLFAAYRFSSSRSSKTLASTGNAYSFGVSGGFLPKLSGSINFGVQTLNSHHKATFTPTGEVDVPSTNETFTSLFGSVGLSYTMTKKAALALALSDDFSTTATDVSINSRSVSLHGSYSFNRRLGASGGVTYAQTQFLGARGQGRHDEALIFDASVNYSLTSKIKLNLNYTETYNYSTVKGSDFGKRVISGSVLARY